MHDGTDMQVSNANILLKPIQQLQVSRLFSESHSADFGSLNSSKLELGISPDVIDILEKAALLRWHVCFLQ